MQKHYYELGTDQKLTTTMDWQITYQSRNPWLLQEVEGKTDKGRMFKYSNKNTLLLKTNVLDNFRFPILSKDYLNHSFNEIRNSDKIK